MRIAPSKTTKLSPATRQAPIRFVLVLAWLGCALLVGCGSDETASGSDTALGTGSSGTDQGGGTAETPVPLFHDFGVIPHGERGTADIDLPLPEGDGWVPLAFTTGCPCAKQTWILTTAEGKQLTADALTVSRASLIPAPGDRLTLRLTIDTNEKEPADLEPSTLVGQVIFQRSQGADFERKMVPLRFRYGIDAPFTVQPLPAIDIGDISLSQVYKESFVIDREGAEVQFGEPRVKTVLASELTETDELTIETTDHGDRFELEFEIRPAGHRDLAPFQFLIEVPTDRTIDTPDGPETYELKLTCQGVLRPDVYSRPPHRFAFGRVPHGEPKTLRVVVEDYDPDRRPGFQSLGVIDRDGEDLSEHFEVLIQSLPHRPRTSTVDLTFDGLLDKRSIRAELRLANIDSDETLLTIPVTGFPLPPGGVPRQTTGDGR